MRETTFRGGFPSRPKTNGRQAKPTFLNRFRRRAAAPRRRRVTQQLGFGGAEK
jgi:hypothetical protein